MVTLGDPSRWTDQPGTIEDLLADARALGFPATKRLIHDWIAVGLLDHPERRTRGAKGGSDKALFPWTQRNLFRLLASKRHEVKGIAGLCGVPVALWLWYGDEYAPTSQVQRALATWAGHVSKVSWRSAQRQARQTTEFLDDHLGASKHQRDHLIELLSEIAYSGKLSDEQELARAVVEVFDPERSGRTFGATGAVGTVESVVDLIAGNVRGMERIRERVSFQELNQARAVYRNTHMEWARYRPSVTEPVRPKDVVLFKPETVQDLYERACSQLMLIIGMLNGRVAPQTSPHESAPGAAPTARGQTTGGSGSHGKQKT